MNLTTFYTEECAYFNPGYQERLVSSTGFGEGEGEGLTTYRVAVLLVT